MSFDDLNVFDKDGNPRGVILPTQAIVIAEPGVRLTENQDAEIRHAYKLFTDVCHASGTSYQVVNRELSDGTRIRMERNTGNDRLWVWPVGGEEEEIWLLGSPRAVYADGGIFDGVIGKEVFLYAIRNKSPMRLVRPEIFKEKDGLSALNQQPGNAFWHDRRAERKTKRWLSWWTVVQRSNNYERPDRLDASTFFWNNTTDPNRLYIDGEFLVKFDHPVYGAAIYQDENSVEYVRVALVHSSNHKTIYTYQFKLEDANNQSEWVSDFGGANHWVDSPIEFNSAGTKFCCIEENQITIDSVISYSDEVVEYDFASMQKTSVFSGNLTVIGQPTVVPTETTYTGTYVVDGDAHYMYTTQFSGSDYLPANDPTPGSYNNIIYYPSEPLSSYQETCSWVREGRRSGAVTLRYELPVAAGYGKDEQVAFCKLTRERVATVNDSRFLTESVTATVVLTKTWREYVNESNTVLATQYDGHTEVQNPVSTFSSDISTSLSHVENISVSIVAPGEEDIILYESGWHTTCSVTMSSSISQVWSTDTAPMRSYADIYLWNHDTTVGTSVSMYPGTGGAGFTHTTSGSSDKKYGTDAWKSIYVDVFAVDFRKEFAGLVVAEFSPLVVVDGKIAETLTLKEFFRWTEVLSRTETRKPRDPYSWVPPSDAVGTDAGSVVHVIPAEKTGHYDVPPSTIFTPVFEFTSISGTDRLDCPTEGTYGYNGIYDYATLFVSSNILSVDYKKKFSPIIISGLVTNYSLSSFSESVNLLGNSFYDESAYIGLRWATGGYGGTTMDKNILKDDPLSGVGILHHILPDGSVIDDESVIRKSLPEGTGDSSVWLSSPIYIPTWKIPK